MQVARDLFFATAIIITAYLAAVSVPARGGEALHAHGLHGGYALTGAVLVALALIPGLALFLAEPRKISRNSLARLAARHYEGWLELVFALPRRP